MDYESLYEAWEIFKELLHRFPYYGILHCIQLERFYNGLNPHTRLVVDTSTNGALLSKSGNEAYEIIERIASNNYQWQTNRSTSRRRVAGVHETVEPKEVVIEDKPIEKEESQPTVKIPTLEELELPKFDENKLPSKLKDLGSLIIACNIGESYCGKALCDLGEIINLMQYISKVLGIGEVRPTTVTPQLADRSLAYPEGKIEDVLVRVDRFIFPIDFIVLDFEADKNVPIILRRPFLATRITLIDLQKGEVMMRVQDDQNNFVNGQLERNSGTEPLKDEEGNENMALMEANMRNYVQPTQFEPLELEAREYTQPKLAIEEPLKFELTVLPSHLKYIYLGNCSTFPLIVSVELTEHQEE
ncbi:Retrovirus-related Pol polyprotein from transposon opus [Gossypium australe]|uniref:Retrovirus-related Pol polyprotein from transposon opus n=1 Tax=Gossypium australe TaxID=47621 RepID=A0A5B6UJ95_9ROSI|nr:Retrovirus-related Pol polyprotein from transposon opus [Gossypium australe]